MRPIVPSTWSAMMTNLDLSDISPIRDSVRTNPHISISPSNPPPPPPSRSACLYVPSRLPSWQFLRKRAHLDVRWSSLLGLHTQQAGLVNLEALASGEGGEGEGGSTHVNWCHACQGTEGTTGLPIEMVVDLCATIFSYQEKREYCVVVVVDFVRTRGWSMGSVKRSSK